MRPIEVRHFAQKHLEVIQNGVGIGVRRIDVLPDMCRVRRINHLCEGVVCELNEFDAPRRDNRIPVFSQKAKKLRLEGHLPFNPLGPTKKKW